MIMQFRELWRNNTPYNQMVQVFPGLFKTWKRFLDKFAAQHLASKKNKTMQTICYNLGPRNIKTSNPTRHMGCINVQQYRDEPTRELSVWDQFGAKVGVRVM